MPQMSRRKILLSMVLLALSVRVVFFLAVRPWEEQVLQEVILSGDAPYYHELAVHVLSEGSFSSFGSF